MAKTTKVIVSGIVPRNDNLQKLGNDVNIELEKCCREVNIPFVDHTGNINPKIHLERDKLHLSRTGAVLLSENVLSILEKC